jgi:hypothetical protein
MPGFPIDVDTVALYHFDELAAGNYATMIDSAANGGARHLTCGSGDLAPDITNCHNVLGEAIRYAKALRGSDSTGKRATRAGDATLLALFNGSFTLELLIAIDTQVSGQCAISYSGTSDASAPADNTQMALQFGSDGVPRQFWESGGGTNHTVIPAVGHGLVTGEWGYVAQRVDRTGKVVRTAVRRMSESACTFEDTAYATNPTGGDDASVLLRFGNIGTSGSLASFNGRVACIRVSNVLRSDAEMEAQADKLDATMKFDDDASTVLLYLCNEAPDAIDQCSAGNHLRAVGNVLHAVQALLPDPAGTGRAKYLSGSGLCELVGPVGAAALALNTVFKGDNCIEFFFRVGDNNTLVRGLATFGDPGPEDSANNFFGWELFQTPARSMRVWHEHGSGLESTYVTGTLWTVEQVVGYRVVAVNTDFDSGNMVHTVFENGVLIAGPSGAITAYDGGSSGVMRIGRGPAEANSFYGVLDSIRISSRTRTADELEDSFEQVTDNSPPEIGDPVPTESTSIDRLDFVEVAITDDVGVTSLSVVVTMEGDTFSAYEAGAFSARFLAGGSQLLGTAQARDLELRPGGGWPAGGSVTITVVARDASGNTATRTWSYTIAVSPAVNPNPSPIATGNGGFGLVP